MQFLMYLYNRENNIVPYNGCQMQINKTCEKENEMLQNWKGDIIKKWVQKNITRCLLDSSPLLKIAIFLT